MPQKAAAKARPKAAKATKPVAASPASRTDLWFNVFMSIFGISLFFSGIQSLGLGINHSAELLGVVAALSGGAVLGLSMGRLQNRKRK